MGSGRLDVILQALDGPLANHGELRLKGPLAEIGAQPAPGGLTLPVRGLASTHVRISVRPDGQAEIVPVGDNQVRLGPHANVRWELVDPIREATVLNEGGVMYLGPLGRGALVQLVRLEAMDWTAGRVGSTAADVASLPVAGAKQAVARSALRISPASLGVGVVGCGFGVAAIALTVAILIAFPPFTQVTPLGPRIEGEEMYATADMAHSQWLEQPAALEGVSGAWDRFVSAPSARAADEIGQGQAMFSDVEQRDEDAFRHFVASGERHLAARAFWRRLDVVKEEYAGVLTQVREAGLPDAVAAIPFTESRYRPREQSAVCARGWWQFMPEVAVRTGLAVDRCQIRRPTGEIVSWTPQAGAPARFKNSPYIDHTGAERACAIQRCATDERENLAASTRAALGDLAVSWQDQELRAGGVAVLATIVSHNAGYDDSRYGRARQTNVLPAYRRWRSAKPDTASHLFYGANLTCPDDRAARGTCGGFLPAEAQRYGFTVVAQHWLAACYFGQNYGSAYPDAFEGYVDAALDPDGMCRMVAVPRPGEL